MSEKQPQRETWDNYWSSGVSGFLVHEKIIEHVEKHVSDRNAVILEIGPGSGVDTLELAGRGYSILAVDLSLESLKRIKQRAAELRVNVTLIKGDALHLPFKDSVIEFVFHQGLMEHFKNPFPFLDEQKRILKADGHLLVDVPQTFTIYTLRKKMAMFANRWFAGWETQYTPASLRHVLNRAGLKISDMYGRDFDITLFIWLSHIETLGHTRFHRSIIPRFLRNPIGKLWRAFEKRPISNYIRFCIGAVASKDENRN